MSPHPWLTLAPRDSEVADLLRTRIWRAPCNWRTPWAGTGGELIFDLPGVTDLDGQPATLGVRLEERPGLLRDLDAGTTLWADLRTFAFTVIRESEEGPLIVVSAYVGEPPFDTDTAALLEELFGVPVLAEARCEYGPDVPLWDLVVQNEPPLRVLSGEEATLEIDDREYALSVWGEDSLGWTLLAR